MRCIGRDWLSSFRTELLGPTGWLHAAKGLVFLIGIFGLSLTFLALFLSLQSDAIRRNEESLQRFITDLTSDKEQLRVSAISRIPDLISREVYREPSISPIAVAGALLGYDRVLANARPIRDQIKTLLAQGTVNGQHLTERESRTLLDALTNIPPSIWYEDNRFSRVPTLSIDWLWDPRAIERAPAIAAFSRTLLNNAVLQGIFVSDFNLRGAELLGFTCSRCRFERTDLSSARLSGASISDSSFDYCNLDRADLSRSTIQRATFYGTMFRGATFRNATLQDVKLYNFDIGPPPHQPDSPADLRGIVLRSATLSECISAKGANLSLATIDNVSVFRCNLDEIDLSGANCNINMQRSSLRNANLFAANATASKFVGVDLSGAILIRANFRDSQILDCDGFSLLPNETLGVKDVTNFNCPNVQGLSAETIRILIEKRAVQIPCEEEWQRYKRAGYPYETWLSYRRCGNVR